jgi:hypothetical protein
MYHLSKIYISINPLSLHPSIFLLFMHHWFSTLDIRSTREDLKICGCPGPISGQLNPDLLVWDLGICIFVNSTL